jgi:hypothetical protein
MSDIETTYRLIALSDRNNAGQTALTPDLAKLVPGDLVRTNQRLGIERTDWTDHFGKPKIVRTVLIDAEATPEEWTIGVDMPPYRNPPSLGKDLLPTKEEVEAASVGGF